MAISIPVENRSSPSEAGQNSARYTSLRIRVLNVETFIRLLPGSSLHNNSVMPIHDVSILSVMSVEEDIGIHNMPIHNVSLLSLTSTEKGKSDESMASAEILMDTESTDVNNQN